MAAVSSPPGCCVQRVQRRRTNSIDVVVNARPKKLTIFIGLIAVRPSTGCAQSHRWPAILCGSKRSLKSRLFSQVPLSPRLFQLIRPNWNSVMRLPRLFPRSKKQVALSPAPGHYSNEDPETIIFDQGTRPRIARARWQPPLRGGGRYWTEKSGGRSR